MKFIRYLQYGFRDTMRSLWRHKGMVLISVVTVAIMLTVLGATALLAANSEHITNDMEDELEIAVFLQDDLSREDALALEPSFHEIPGFQQATFVPKEEALEQIGQRFDETQLAEATGGVNPLPDVYHIKVEQMEQIAGAVAYLEDAERFPQIELVRYGQDVVENMIALSSTLELVCVVVVAAMLLIALFLVNSTIRLTVAARGEEISIMKYVGATDFYVRIPFFLEGLIIGVIGALIADALLYFGYHAVLDYMVLHISFVDLLDDSKLLWTIMLILLGGGMLLGALGSNIAMRKYLRV